MKVLALDIASSVGFAVGEAGRAPIWGTHRLPKPFDANDFGQRFVAFDQWLSDMIAAHQPSIVAFEEPIAPRGVNMVSNWTTIRFLIGLVSIAELAAHRAGCDTCEANVSTVKKHWGGSGRADKSDMIAACARMGWRVATDHEADAIGLWDYTIHVTRSNRRIAEALPMGGAR